MFMGSENELETMVLLSAIPAVALTQKTSTERSPVTGSMYRTIFFIAPPLPRLLPSKSWKLI